MNNSRDSCEAKPKQNTKASSIMRIEEVVLINSKLSKISISESVERYLSSSASLRKFSNKNKRKLQLFKFENRKAQASKLALIRSKKIFPNFCLTNLKASLLNVRRFTRLIFSSWTQKWFTIFMKKLSIKFLSLINKIINKYSNFFLKQANFTCFFSIYTSVITKKMRVSLIKNINSYLSKINYLNNASFLLNVQTLFLVRLSISEQYIITEYLNANLKSIIKNKPTCELLEQIIILYPKNIVYSLKLTLIKNTMNMIRTSNGMFVLIKIILSESLYYLNEVNNRNNKSLTTLNPIINSYNTPKVQNKNSFSDNELNEIILSKNVFEAIINEIMINFTRFIIIRNGSVILNHLISSLLTRPELSDVLIGFLEYLNIEDVLEISCCKYSNKVVENLLCFPIFNKRFCQFLILEKQKSMVIEDSVLFFLCSKFRGLSILDKIFDEAEYLVASRIYKLLEKISKSDYLQEKHFSHLVEILERRKIEFSDKNIEAQSNKDKKPNQQKLKKNKDSILINKNLGNVKKTSNNDSLNYPTSNNESINQDSLKKKFSSNPLIIPVNNNNTNEFCFEPFISSNKKNFSAHDFINKNYLNTVHNNFSFVRPVNSMSNNNNNSSFHFNNYNNYSSISDSSINTNHQVYNPTQFPLNYNKLYFNSNNLNNNFNKNFNNYSTCYNIDLQSINNFNKPISNYNNYNNYNIDNDHSNKLVYNRNFDFNCKNNRSTINNNVNNILQSNNSINTNYNQNYFNKFTNQTNFALPNPQNLFVNNINYTNQSYGPNDYFDTANEVVNRPVTNTYNYLTENNSNVIKGKTTPSKNMTVKNRSTAKTTETIISSKYINNVKNVNKEKESFCNQVFPEGIFNIHSETDKLNIESVKKN